MNDYNHKPIPRSIAIFGAGGHIGGPLANFLTYHAPQIRLRLISSRPEGVEQLKDAFPQAEAVLANYFDQASLDTAVSGMEGLFVVTTAMTAEEPAMNNLVDAVRKSGTLQQMIRIVGLQPDANPRRVPKVLRDFGLGIEIQHELAREILDEAELPVTYLNCGASFMDNFLRLALPIRTRRTLVWPSRLIPYLDPRELGEVAARIFLSDNQRHLYQFHTLNNGHDLLRTGEVVEMMSDVFQYKINHDPSREGFIKSFEPALKAGMVPPTMPDYLWNFFAYEQDNEVAWIPNKFMELILGRKPTTLRSWLQEHRAHFLS
jgi:hypothetical protein